MHWYKQYLKLWKLIFMCGFAYFKVLDGNFDLSLLKDQSLKILAKGS